MLIGPWSDVALAATSASIGVVCLAGGLHGYLIRTTTWWEQIMLIAAALVLITPGLYTDLTGISLVIAVVLSQKFIARKELGPVPMGSEAAAPMEALTSGQSGKSP
jgi:TRAP-type uncharacterized transport system fused permease subunit